MTPRKTIEVIALLSSFSGAVPAAEIQAVSGAVGLEDRQRMLQSYADYNLHLAFAHADGAYLAYRLRHMHRLRRADNLADAAVYYRVDPMTQQIAEFAELEFGDGRPVLLTVAAGDGIDNAAQQPFIGR